MTKAKAGRAVSIRMPEGSVEELKAATGQKFSTLCRWVMLSLLEKHKRDLRQKEAARQTQQDVKDIVEAMPSEVPEGDA